MSLLAAILFTVSAGAQQSVVDAINAYGTFDSWSMREVKESGLIGGATKTLYEFYGDQETVFTGKTPFCAPEGYLWRTNNVLAVVAGVVKTNNYIYIGPFITMITAALTIGEPVSLAGVAGTACIIVGVVLAGRQKKIE